MVTGGQTSLRRHSRHLGRYQARSERGQGRDEQARKRGEVSAQVRGRPQAQAQDWSGEVLRVFGEDHD